MTESTTRTITPEQARRELARRKLPRDQRGEGRRDAVRSGVFRMSREELERIAAEETEA